MTASLLKLTKPGAAIGQIILVVDLTIAGDTAAVMQAIADLGYTPEIRHVLYPEHHHPSLGRRIMAVGHYGSKPFEDLQDLLQLPLLQKKLSGALVGWLRLLHFVTRP